MSNIQFEHIEPYIEGQGGDTGYSSRGKLRRNFEKIKAWMDSVATTLSGKFLSKENDDEAKGVITFRVGALFGPLGAWGWVKEQATRTVNGAQQTIEDGVAWFRWLLLDRLQVSGIAEFLSHLYIKGSSQIDGNLTVGTEGNENTGNINATGSIHAGKDLTASEDLRVGRDGSIGRNLNVGDTVTTKNLLVTGSAHFFEVIIDKIKSAGGAVMLTAANGTVDHVTSLSGKKRVFFLAKDKDGKAITNDWEVGDGALCMTTNFATGVQYDKSNKYYWSRVVGKGTVTVDNCDSGQNEPTDYHYIDLSTSDKAADCTVNPSAGDELVQLGWNPNTAGAENLSELDRKGRQSAIYLASYVSLDQGYRPLGDTCDSCDEGGAIRALVPPLIAYYEGIDDFSLAQHRTTFKDSLGGKWVGDLMVTSDTSLEDYIKDKFENYDPKADFYRLLPLKENALVAANKTLSVELEYQLQHVANGTASTEAWTNSGFSVVVKANGSTKVSTNENTNYDANGSTSVIFSKGYTANATKPDYFTVTLMKGDDAIGQRVVRVEMKAGTVFSVTDAGIAAAAQRTDELGRTLRSEFAVTADGIRSEVSSLGVSKNLLLNADFEQETATGRGSLHLVPQVRWQGYQWESRDGNGDWQNVLTRNAKYTISFYAKGTGKVLALIHFVNPTNGVHYSSYQCDKVFELTADLRRYTYTFTSYDSASHRAVRVMLGSTGEGQEMAVATGTEMWISRPQLEKAAAATDWSGTAARNLLPNSSFDAVTKGIPDGWTLWDNYEVNNEPYPVTLREVAEEKWLALWGFWKGNSNKDAKVLNVRTDAANGWRYLYLEPSDIFQGIQQESRVRSDGEWQGLLVHGEKYTLSFYARGTGRCDGLIHLVKVNGSHISQPQPALVVEITDDDCTVEDETTIWRRFAYEFTAVPQSSADYDIEHGYGFSLMLGCAHYSEDPNSVVPDEKLEIAHPQLEVGSLSAWKRGEENPELVATRFEQAADKMELAVYRDGEKRSGMKLDLDGVEFDGDRVKINGDLDLQGLTTENVTPVVRSHYRPTLVNMGVLADEDDRNAEHVVKSVLVKGDNNGVLSDDLHMVVLPFYDSNNAGWVGSTDIQLNADGTFFLNNLAGVPDWQRRVVQWKKSGTRLTIANEVIMKYRNWQSIDDASAASRLGGMVVVCSDARIVSAANLSSQNNRFNPSALDASLGAQPNLHAGCFSCGGYMSRFIILLPGQTLQLRSQIVRFSGGGRDVLTWVVENPTEFVPFLKQNVLSQIRLSAYDSAVVYMDYKSNLASFNPSDGYQGSQETIMGPKVLENLSDRTLNFESLYY